MNVLIIEDEQQSALKLKNYLNQIDSEITVLSVLKSVKESISYLKNHLEPDLIFLDVQLTDGESFDIFKSVTTKAFIIFVTAYDQHALKAFDLNTLSYLLKPFDQSDVVNALKKFRSYQKPHEGSFYKTRFLVKKGKRSYTFSIGDIAYFIKDEVLFLVAKSGEKFLMETSLSALEKSLREADFFRINRNCLVHYDSIESFAPDSSHRYRLKLKQIDHEEMIVSQGRVSDFKEWITK